VFVLHSLLCTLRYNAKQRARIGQYCAIHGPSATARYFSRKLKCSISDNTVKSIKKSYQEEQRKRKRRGEDEHIESLPEKKRGRGFLIGDDLDHLLQLYLRKIRSNGGPVTARIAIAAARGLLHAENQHKLVKYGGHIKLNRHWAYSLFKRMNFVPRKPTTSKSKNSVKDFAKAKKEFLQEVVTTVEMEGVPPELIMNWDQTGIKIVPTTTWTMERRGSKRVEVVGTNDKRQITAVFCGTIQGDFLPVQLIYTGKTARCHPKYKFPAGWHVTHAKKHWSTEKTMLQYIERIILPYVNSVRMYLSDDTVAGLVIMDNFKGQVTATVSKLLEDNHLHVCLLPPNTTDFLQPMDLSVNKPAKSFLKNEFSEWYSDEILQQLRAHRRVSLNQIELDPIDLGLPALKELGAQWLVKMVQYIEDNPQFVMNGFIKAGISKALDNHSADLSSEGSSTSSDGSSTSSDETYSEESSDSEDFMGSTSESSSESEERSEYSSSEDELIVLSD